MARSAASVIGARLAFVCASALAAVACGPSYQAVYECDVRFEHCYALDQGASTVEARKACWREWLGGYTYGQSRDRVDYAGTRLSELSLDPTLPSVESREGRPPRVHSVAAPVPTNAFAPPPSMVEHAVAEPAPSSSALASHPATRAPGEECTQACTEKWKACRGTCDGASASERGKQCTVCDRTYRACVPGCFR